MWVVSGFPAFMRLLCPSYASCRFIFHSQPQMKKYRCLWGMSIPNHNILCLDAIPGTQSQNPSLCPVESPNRTALSGLWPFTCHPDQREMGPRIPVSCAKPGLQIPPAIQAQAYAPIRSQTRPHPGGNKGPSVHNSTSLPVLPGSLLPPCAPPPTGVLNLFPLDNLEETMLL